MPSVRSESYKKKQKEVVAQNEVENIEIKTAEPEHTFILCVATKNTEPAAYQILSQILSKGNYGFKVVLDLQQGKRYMVVSNERFTNETALKTFDKIKDCAELTFTLL